MIATAAFFAPLMTEKTLVLGFIFLIDHDSEGGAANGSDDSGSDQDVQALSALDDKFIHCNFPFCGRGISSAVKGTLPAATQRRNALHEVGSFVMPAGP